MDLHTFSGVAGIHAAFNYRFRVISSAHSGSSKLCAVSCSQAEARTRHTRNTERTGGAMMAALSLRSKAGLLWIFRAYRELLWVEVLLRNRGFGAVYKAVKTLA